MYKHAERFGTQAANLVLIGSLVALSSSGNALGQSVRAWGFNNHGQSDVPADVGPTIAIGAGGAHGLALRADGTIRCWGYNDYGQCTPPAGMLSSKAVSAGVFHSVALEQAGTVRCWGWNFGGICDVPTDLGPVSAIAAGYYHTAALTTAGAIRCWGQNGYGQCNVPAGLGSAVALGAGGNHTIAITPAGTVLCWGQTMDGVCDVPVDLGPATRVAVGAYHAAAVNANGAVRCWGRNLQGQCNVPPGLGTVRAIAIGEAHTVALTNSGTVRCWGAGLVNTGSDQNYGQSIVPTGIGPVSSIAAGDSNTVALVNLDCDQNGIPDVGEILGHDCNGNSILDACDAASDVLEDCNNNGIGDTCEKQLSVSIASGRLGPIGYQSNQIWTVSGAVRAESAVLLRVNARGDFSGMQEYVRIRIGNGFDEIALRSTNDCAIGYPECSATFVLAPETFNAAIGLDGVLRASFEPSIAVDSNGCLGGTWIEASLDYVGARAADCNANGLLDGCEIAAGFAPDSNHNGVIDTCESLILPCPADFDQSGFVDGADLGRLLSAWGVTGQPGLDLNHDGRIDGADLGLVLSSWGSCAN